MENRYSFRPRINRRRQTSPTSSGTPQEGTVFDRLLQYASKITEKKKELEVQMHNRVDPATGQHYFRPRIGRKPLIPVSFGVFMGMAAQPVVALFMP